MTAHYELQADSNTEVYSDIINESMPIFRSAARGHMACYQFYVIAKVPIRIHPGCLSFKRTANRLREHIFPPLLLQDTNPWFDKIIMEA